MTKHFFNCNSYSVICVKCDRLAGAFYPTNGIMFVFGNSDPGRVRNNNQDAFLAERFSTDKDYALAVVCDGMGGTKSGHIASRLALDKFADYVRNRLVQNSEAEKTQTGDIISYKTILYNAVKTAYNAVVDRAASDPECADMGTTIVAALLCEDGNVHIVNVGDSRCYFLHTGGGNSSTEQSDKHKTPRTKRVGVRQVTKDHSLVEDLIDKGEIKRTQARTHPKRNYITRALSPDVNWQPDSYTEKLDAHDFLLLCSDGLSNLVLPPEMLFELTYNPPDEAVQRCMSLALSRGAPDNVTVVVVTMINDTAE